MNILLENWFFLLIIVLCVGMHFFHGHGHGHSSGGDAGSREGSSLETHGHGGHNMSADGRPGGAEPGSPADR